MFETAAVSPGQTLEDPTLHWPPQPIDGVSQPSASTIDAAEVMVQAPELDMGPEEQYQSEFHAQVVGITNRGIKEMSNRHPFAARQTFETLLDLLEEPETGAARMDPEEKRATEENVRSMLDKVTFQESEIRMSLTNQVKQIQDNFPDINSGGESIRGRWIPDAKSRQDLIDNYHLQAEKLTETIEGELTQEQVEALAAEVTKFSKAVETAADYTFVSPIPSVAVHDEEPSNSDSGNVHTDTERSSTSMSALEKLMRDLNPEQKAELLQQAKAEIAQIRQKALDELPINIESAGQTARDYILALALSDGVSDTDKVQIGDLCVLLRLAVSPPNGESTSDAVATADILQLPKELLQEVTDALTAYFKSDKVTMAASQKETVEVVVQTVEKLKEQMTQLSKGG